MNSLGSCINTFGRYKKGNSKRELGILLIFDLVTLHYEKYLNLSHSAKCSVGTQLTYIQKYSTIRFQSVQESKLQYKGLPRSKSFLHLKNCNFANSVIFAILDFLDFWVSCHFGFLLLWYHFANFIKPTLILRNFGFCLKPRLINITRLNPVQK